MSTRTTPDRDGGQHAGPSRKLAGANLSDLPAPWLALLLTTLERDEVLALFRSCKTLRDLALEQRTLVMRFALPAPLAQTPPLVQSLQLACKYQSQVKLVFHRMEYTIHQMPIANNKAASALMLGAAGQDGLHAVRSVQLEGLVLDALVPSWLTSTCPNMATLYLDSCQYRELPSPTVPVPECSQLKHLHLHRPQPITENSLLLQWQHQLRSLSGLTSLTISVAAEDQMSVFSGGAATATSILECCSVLKHQLTHLQLSAGVFFPLGQLSADLLEFSNVTALCLADKTVVDDDMDVLLKMHAVKRLQCKGFQLTRTYAHRPCPWTQLAFQTLDIDSYCFLPAPKSLHFTAHYGGFTIHPSFNTEVTTQALAALTSLTHWDAKCLQWDQAVDNITLDNGKAVADCACLAALLPLVSTCNPKTVTLMHGVHVTPEFLTAMERDLCGPALSSVVFASCTWCPYTGIWPLVLSTLSRVRMVRLDARRGRMGEEDLTQACVHAARPVVVKVWVSKDQWPEGWQERVREAMAEAGHQHVTFTDE